MAQAKEAGEGLTANDGSGFYDNDGLIDTLIVDCNELVNDLKTGNNIRFCGRLVGMVQKLTNLQKGIRDDIASRDAQIEELKKMDGGGSNAS